MTLEPAEQVAAEIQDQLDVERVAAAWADASLTMKRILTAVVLIGVVVAAVLYGPVWLLASLAAVVAGLAAYEYRDLAHLSWASGMRR